MRFYTCLQRTDLTKCLDSGLSGYTAANERNSARLLKEVDMLAAPPRKLIDDVAERTGLRRSAVKDVLIAAFEIIKESAETGSVMIRGFGTFHTATRAGCTRPSPSNPDLVIEVPPTKRLALRAPADRI